MSDLISRQDAIDALSKEYRKDDSDYPTQYQLGLSKAKQIIQALPSAQRKGKWVPSDVPESTLCECDQCGFDCGAYCFSYCPICGADMRGEEDV